MTILQTWWRISFDIELHETTHNRWKVIERSGLRLSLPWLLRNYECDARTCNQLRNLWQFSHSKHMEGQTVILHAPFVTDAFTSRIQHVWPYCTHRQHWILHNVLSLSKHDDGETSNKYQSSCPDYSPPFWVMGLWEGSVWVLRSSRDCDNTPLQALTPRNANVEVTSFQQLYTQFYLVWIQIIWIKQTYILKHT